MNPVSSDDGIVGLIIAAPFVALLLWVFYLFNNTLDSTPAYQSLLPAQQSTAQNIQNLGAQAIVLADPTALEVVGAIVGIVFGIVALIALLKRE